MRTTKDTFRLSISPAHFALEGRSLTTQAFDVLSIERFVGDRDLTIRLASGPVRLPCSMTIRDHAALAARLNELLAQSKAMRGGDRDG